MRAPNIAPNDAVPASAIPNILMSTSVLSSQVQDSPVMNETLSVIQEHISNMSTPRSSGIADRKVTNDSGSEYSSHIDRRASYINGSETDEEEDRVFNQVEVSTWTASQVAEYLATMGVEPKHCDVFLDQEISGDVLLGLDQSSIFLKEFELGSVGRRLKTWQKIKSLQDEVHGIESPMASRRATSNYGSEVGSDAGGRRSQSYSNNGGVLPRATSSGERPGSRQNARNSQRQGGRLDSFTGQSPVFASLEEQTRPPVVPSRPSAASIRELNHSRRHSSIDSTALLNPANYPEASQPATSAIPPAIGHKKLPSFDRNWTMGTQSSLSPVKSRPLSQAGSQPIGGVDDLPGINRTTTSDLDRGYFSGTEADGRGKNVLKKRTGSHSRNSSYADEQRLRSATAVNRQSRYGSVDSIQQSHMSTAGQKYYGLTGSRRTPSVGSIRPPPSPPPKDTLSPIVTKLDENFLTGLPKSPQSSKSPKWLRPKEAPATARGSGFRTTSDAVTGNEKAKVGDQLASPTDSNRSPSRTDSTPSAGPSFDLDSPNTSKSTFMSTPTSRGSKKKSKKETSAYTRGLQKSSPKEAMTDCDYSGWMKKKNTNLMTTWKPRLFILKGRRLSYYYSEDDTEEKGLIDISFHRVLPADNDRLTGLHATLTGATSSPNSPHGANTPTIASTEAAAEAEKGLKPESDSIFIFKLVPPRAGLSRAVTFTKPTVHFFAVPNIAQGRLWMAALMKATIDRDDTTPITTTYQQKTISLAKARAMRSRPPALMNLDEKVEDEVVKSLMDKTSGLNIQGVDYTDEKAREDSGIGGLRTSGERPLSYGGDAEKLAQPQTTKGVA